MTTSYLSMRKFSKMMGLSPSTVSQVFSNPQLVAPETAKRVLDTAELVGFSPSMVAKSAFGKATQSVGIILASLSDTYFGGIAAAMQQELLKADYLPIFLATNGPDAAEEDAVTRLLKYRVDALVIGCPSERLDIPLLCRRQMANLPIVVVDQARPGFWHDSVLNDDYDGGFQAGRHLAGLGHRRFAAFSYGEAGSNCVARLNGFRDAVRGAGGWFPDDGIVSLPFNLPNEELAHEEVRRRMAEVLRGSSAPTAIFAPTDYLALDAYEAAKAAGRGIPEEVSVVGFGELQFGPYMSPGLTTVRQFPERIGEKVVELLLARLREPKREMEEVRVGVELVARGSTAINNQ